MDVQDIRFKTSAKQDGLLSFILRMRLNCNCNSLWKKTFADVLQVSPSFFPFSSTINIPPRIYLFFIASTFCSSSASPTSPHFISFLLLTVRYLFFLLFTPRESQSPSAKTIITSLAMQLASMLILQKGANPTAQRNPIILCKASLGPSGAALIYTRVTPTNWCREKKNKKNNNLWLL